GNGSRKKMTERLKHVSNRGIFKKSIFGPANNLEKSNDKIMSEKNPFGSDKVIIQHISKADLKTYFVGFDFGEYRYDKLVDLILDVIVDFAFGFHKGILSENYNRRILIEAAKSIYGIKKKTESGEVELFLEAKKIFVDRDSDIEDEDTDNKYLKRGEFGELILHLLLRDFIVTVPLISKIFFKDTDGATVHGFDAVHIGPSVSNPSKRSLYLGESKLYNCGKTGVTELIGDIENHFKKDFLRREFALISKKQDSFLSLFDNKDKNSCEEYKEFLKEKEKWFKQLDEHNKLQDILDSVTIPLLCTYTSEIFSKHTDEETEEFIEDYECEIEGLKEHFDKKVKNISGVTEQGEPIITNLNIILMLFPVPSKKELVKRLHTRLHNQQGS
ncbi:MAG: DUF1837 domain-containing protein, partial [Thermodesulfobacteriota bacterium]|nr:DUF1837 domain-containing protein [Thermodesulfobacteriota bacterium]